MDQDPNAEPPISVNPGYALGQLAKALTTCQEHQDSQTRERAQKKVAKWLQVFEGVINGSIAVGSRTPLSAPEWVTLEVATGGFATGAFLAGGELRDHERRLLEELAISTRGNERQILNAYFLTEDGFARLRAMLASGCFEIDTPEEGALLTVAWLLDHGHPDQAREILSQISSFFDQLRFYPIPTEQPRPSGSRVFLQDVATTAQSVAQIAPNRRMLAQQEAIKVWAPLYDRTLQLLLETVEGEPPHVVAGEPDDQIAGGWPGRRYPDGWRERASDLLEDYATQRRTHTLCRRPDSKRGSFLPLRTWLQQCCHDPQSVTDRDRGRMRYLLAHCIERYGAPQSSQLQEMRDRQRTQIRHPSHYQLAQVALARLAPLPPKNGVEQFDALAQPVTTEEADRFQLPAAYPLPPSVLRKMQRCQIDTADALIAKGIITSADTLARILPQITSGLRAAGVEDPALRRLDAALYRAFRRRRSLLLLNLESQIKIEELPWAAAIDSFRRNDLTTREVAKGTLQEIVALALTSFPYAILPNKLLQELRSLAKDAKLDLPLVDELAADIFMGKFSAKFQQAAQHAAALLEGTLYERYYAIDYAEVRKLSRLRALMGQSFAAICCARAQAPRSPLDVTTNGMIIEQQQILTTQNLAVLFAGLELGDELRGRLGDLARQCFRWICARQQANAPTWHALLIMLKSTAYAWRQMIFFLSLLPSEEVDEFLADVDRHLGDQPADFQTRFRPALNGLRRAAAGPFLTEDATARRFLGWTKQRHWLLGPKT